MQVTDLNVGVEGETAAVQMAEEVVVQVTNPNVGVVGEMATMAIAKQRSRGVAGAVSDVVGQRRREQRLRAVVGEEATPLPVEQRSSAVVGAARAVVGQRQVWSAPHVLLSSGIGAASAVVSTDCAVIGQSRGEQPAPLYGLSSEVRADVFSPSPISCEGLHCHAGSDSSVSREGDGDRRYEKLRMGQCNCKGTVVMTFQVDLLFKVLGWHVGLN